MKILSILPTIDKFYAMCLIHFLLDIGKEHVNVSEINIP